jgi:HEPN domain-containing protein
LYRSDFQKLAADRLADSQALFKAKRYDAAFYLAGYAVECALKACIARRRRRHEFPLSPEAAREIYSHDFDGLVRAAGLTKSIEQARVADPRFALYWETPTIEAVARAGPGRKP